MRTCSLIIALLTIPCFARADGKGDYTLFHPTPRDQMREMSPDRPDATESPFTVDAGHFQTETTIFGYTKDGDVKSYHIGETNFKAGLTNQVDLEIVVPFYERETGGGASDGSGIGDPTIRLKWNVWGNDGGDTAFAVMPFVITPTASHDFGNEKVEGGVILPLEVNLAERLSITFMAVFDAAYDDVRKNYGMDFVNTASLSVSWTDRLGSFFEFASVASTRADEKWQGYGDTGITFAVTDNIVLDAGIAVGLVRASDDFAAFTGISMRF